MHYNIPFTFSQKGMVIEFSLKQKKKEKKNSGYWIKIFFFVVVAQIKSK